jgi:hypothetical protein
MFNRDPHNSATAAYGGLDERMNEGIDDLRRESGRVRRVGCLGQTRGM